MSQLARHIKCKPTKLNRYENEQQFMEDVKLIFTNCKIFNEDDSPVGKAGQAIRRFFNRRWKELKSGTKAARVRKAVVENSEHK